MSITSAGVSFAVLHSKALGLAMQSIPTTMFACLWLPVVTGVADCHVAAAGRCLRLPAAAQLKLFCYTTSRVVRQ